MEDLPATSGELCAAVPGLQPMALTLRAGQIHDVGDVTLPQLVAVSGRLVSRFGEPEDATVRLYRQGAELVEVEPVAGAFTAEVAPGDAGRGGDIPR